MSTTKIFMLLSKNKCHIKIKRSEKAKTIHKMNVEKEIRKL